MATVPWRLLRSLVATWKRKAPTLPENAVRELFTQILSPPEFYLPPATTGHTRHYMPFGLEKKKEVGHVEKRILVFDTFVTLPPNQELIILWPDAELTPDQRSTLQTLLQNLTYFGRSESWCEARLLDSSDVQQIQSVNSHFHVYPLNCGYPKEETHELVRVLCPDPQTALGNEYVQSKDKKSKRPSYDPAWNLCIETAQLHAERWSDPPGSCWVTYVRPLACLESPPSQPKPRPMKTPEIHVVRYALDSNILPLVTETLPIAELIRITLMGIYGRRFPEPNGEKGRSPIFSGKDENGQPLRHDHKHAYYLLTDEDGDGRLDHLTIVAEDGFGSKELTVLDQLRRLKRSEDLPELRFLLLGMGNLKEFQPFPIRPAATWVSATPFLVTRYPKKYGQKRDPKELLENPHAFILHNLREELQRWLQRRGHSFSVEQVRIRPLYDPPGVFRIQPHLWEPSATGPRLRPIQFQRFRTRKPNDDGDRRLAGAFELLFPKPVPGPLCLGHSAHFGLGLFLPAQKTQNPKETPS